MLYLEPSNLETLKRSPRRFFDPPLFNAVWNYYVGCRSTVYFLRKEDPFVNYFAAFEIWASQKVNRGGERDLYGGIIQQEADDAARFFMFVQLWEDYVKAHSFESICRESR